MLSFSFHFIVSFNVKTLFNNFFSSMSEFLACSRQYHDACVCIPLFGNELQCLHVHLSCYSREYAAETDTEEKNYWIKLLILFSLCTKYSRSFINVRFKHWCHMDYLNDALTTFLDLECVSSVAVDAGSESSRTSLVFKFVFWRWTNV